MKKITLDTQFRAIALYSVATLGHATVQRMKEGPARMFLSKWNERAASLQKGPRLSGIVSDLREEGVLRRIENVAGAPIYAKGENFELELERVFDIIFESDDVEVLAGANGAAELSVDTEAVIIPMEVLYDSLEQFGYLEEQKLLFVSE